MLSNSFRDIEYSFFVWGSFDKGIVVDNPLSRISSRFNERPFITRDRGGNVDYKKYFSGRKSSLFFGGIYQVNDDLSLIFELDPTDTEFDYVPYKKKLTKFNFGFSHEYKDFYFKYSFQRGKTFGVQITYHKDSSKFNAISTKQNSQQILTPQDLKIS